MDPTTFSLGVQSTVSNPSQAASNPFDAPAGGFGGAQSSNFDTGFASSAAFGTNDPGKDEFEDLFKIGAEKI